MKKYSAEQLRPSFPPRLPFSNYPPRCPQCRAFIECVGSVRTATGLGLHRIECTNKHGWYEVTT